MIRLCTTIIPNEFYDLYILFLTAFGILNHFWNILMKVIKLKKMVAIIVNHAVKSSINANSVLSSDQLMLAMGR